MHVVDSCGWLEFIAGGRNAGFFEAILVDESALLVPPLVVFEVTRRLRVLGQVQALDPVLTVMERLTPATLTLRQMADAAHLAQTHRLALADAVIWHTAQVHGAALYTQDVDLEGLPGVIYQSKLS